MQPDGANPRPESKTEVGGNSKLRRRFLTPKLRNSEARKGLFSIATGTAAGQIIVFLSAPLLSRLYTPTEFGKFSIVSALTVVVATAVTLRLELAIPLPDDEREAFSLAALAVVASTTLNCVLVMALFFLSDEIAASFNEPGLAPLLWITPPMAVASSVLFVLTQLAIRQRRFRAIANRNILQAAVTVSAQIIGGLARLGAHGLVAGLAIGYCAGAISLLRGSRFRTVAARQGYGPSAMKALLGRYKKFPLLMGPAGLLNALAFYLPLLLIAYWHGTEIAGWLGLTQRVVAVPLTLIATAASQVYLSQIARLAHKDPAEAIRSFHRTSKPLIIAGLVVLVILVVGSPWAFEVAFGPEWKQSGDYARLLAPAVALQLVAVPLAQTLVVLEKQRAILVWDAVRVVALFTGIYMTVAFGASADIAILTVSVVQSAFYLAYYALSFRAVRANLRK